MTKNAGATWLHQVKHRIAQRRVWDKKERELKRLAEKWSDDGVPFEEVLVRIAELRRQTGGAA